MNSIADQKIDQGLSRLYERFGVSATYTGPTGGASVECMVIQDRADRTVDFGDSRTVAQGRIFKVRAAEVSAPAKNGTFTVDGETFTILSAPVAEDGSRLVWRCTVG